MRIEDEGVWLGPTQPGDEEELEERLRPEDRFEVEELNRQPAGRVIFESVRRSERPVTFRTTNENRLVGIYGFSPHTPVSGTAAPWLLGTPELFEHRRVLVRRSRAVIECVLRQRYHMLSNVVWAGNDKSIRYIRALGFDMGPVEHTLFGTPFRRFTRRRDDV